MLRTVPACQGRPSGQDPDHCERRLTIALIASDVRAWKLRSRRCVTD